MHKTPKKGLMPKASILIVEDEAIVAEDLSQKLGRLGYEVCGITASGAQAVQLARERRPDLVLMDIRLRGRMDGVAAAQIIRRECDLAVIYLTAHSDPATLHRAKLSEPFGYILKPFEELELETHIQMALHKHQAEHELRQQQQWLRVTLDSIGDGVITTDVAGKVTSLNPVAEELTGWRIAEALNRPLGEVFNIINEKTRQPASNPVARVFKEGKVVGLANDTALISRDGKERAIEDSAAAIKDSRGRILGVVMVFHDVTEKRRAEVALREREEHRKVMEAVTAERHRFNDVLNTLPAYVILLSPDYHVPFANRFFEERFGRSEGWRCFEYLFNRTEPCEKCETYSVLETHAPHRWEWTGPDGRNYDIYDFPFTDADGSPLIMEAGLDITEVKQAHAALAEANRTLERRVAERTAALREGEDRLRFALETSHTGAWDLDLVDYTAFRSREHDRVFGYPDLLHQWTYEMFLEHVLPEDRAAVDAKFKQATTAQGDWSFECRIRRADGEVRWIWAAGRHRADATGRLRRMAGIVQDITDRKQAEEKVRQQMSELRRANDELARFNRVAVGRELRMIALKQEVNVLRAKLGELPPYPTASPPEAQT